MYRTNAAEPESARPSWDRLYAKTALRYACINGVAFVVYVAFREIAPDPPPQIADRVAVALPFLLSAALAVLCARASRIVRPPLRLAHTKDAPEAFGMFLAGAMLAAWLLVLQLWAFAPYTWSEAWHCTSSGRGKTSCSIDPAVGPFATALFVVGIVPGLLGCLGALVAAVDALRAYGRGSGLVQLTIDADMEKPQPGEPLTIDLGIAGHERIQRLELRLERTFGVRKGKHVREQTQGSVPVLHVTDVAVEAGAPVLLRRTAVVPDGVDRRALRAVRSGLRLVAELVVDGSKRTEVVATWADD